MEATQQMKESKVAKEIFGETFVDHFTQTHGMGMAATFKSGDGLGV